MEDEEEFHPSFSTDGEFLGMVTPNRDMQISDKLNHDDTEDEDFLDDIDEDLKESVMIQKNKIMEMMDRMKRY